MSTLGDLTIAKVDQTGPPRTGEFTYVDISSIDNGLKRIVEQKHLAVAAAPSRARQSLRRGDVLVSMTRPNLNAVAIVPPEFDGAIGSTGFHVLRALEDIEPRWLFYSVQTRNFVESMSALVQGALYPAVRPKDIRAFGIEAPPLDEQRSAVEEIEKQFSRLDEAVASLTRVRAKLNHYKATMLRAAFDGSLVSAVSGSQSRWNQTTLGDVARIFGGLTKNPKRVALPRQLPYLRVANVYANELRLEEIESIGVADSELEKLLLKTGDLLIVEGNGSKDQIGRLAIWDGSIDPCVHQNHLIKVRLNEHVLPKWVLFWLLSPKGRKHIEEVSSSTSGLYTLSINKVAALPVATSSLKEQRQIIAEVERRLEIVSGLDSAIDKNLRRAERFRWAILDKCYTSNKAR